LEKMKRLTEILPALVAGLLVLALALPATAGGRDVPDKEPKSNSSSVRQTLPLDGEPLGCTRQPVQFTTVGGLRIEMSWDEDGRVMLRPAFVSDLARVLGRLLHADAGSCAG
jgi:hypothetical protein